MAGGYLIMHFMRIGTATLTNRPHRLEGQTLLDGVPVRRRVEVRYRRTSTYVISTVTQADGVFRFKRLPEQTLGTPYMVLCYDDRPEGSLNTLIFDRVYSVDDDGLPPQT